MARDKKIPKDERDFLRRKMDAGRRLISAIEQRRGTIHRITEQILERQGDFFEHGIEHLKPLKMQEVADRIGLHVSTVGRALSHKYIDTPQGVFSMKFFFTGGFEAADGTTESNKSIMNRIRQLIDAEDKRNPLSDQATRD